MDFTRITPNFAKQLDNNWNKVCDQETRLSGSQDNLVTKYRNDENILGIARRSWRAGQCGETTSKGCPTYQAMASSSQTLAGKDMYPWNYPKLVPQTPSRQPPDTIGFYNIQTFSGLGGDLRWRWKWGISRRCLSPSLQSDCWMNTWMEKSCIKVDTISQIFGELSIHLH